MLRTVFKQASRVVMPESASICIMSATCASGTKWYCMFWRVVIWPLPPANRSEMFANCSICPAVTTPAGNFVRTIWTPGWRWP